MVPFLLYKIYTVTLVRPATAHISRSSNSRPTGITTDDFSLHMINCHNWHLLSMLPVTAEIFIGILALLMSFGSLVIALLAFLDKRNKRK